MNIILSLIVRLLKNVILKNFKSLLIKYFISLVNKLCPQGNIEFQFSLAIKKCLNVWIKFPSKYNVL